MEKEGLEAPLLMCAKLQRVDQFGHGREQIGFQTVIGHREDRCFGVLVDRHDHLGVLHARQMLDRSRDAAGNVQLRRHDLARLAHLQVVGRVARIDSRTAGTDGRTQLVGQGG